MIRGELATRNNAGTFTTTAQTPTNISPVGAGSGLTGNTNVIGTAASSGVVSSADSGGTYTTILNFNFANTAGYLFKPDPEEEIYIPPSTILVLRLLGSPTAASGWTFQMIIGENV